MYEQFYGFSARPFQLTPDLKFYFQSASHRKGMACLDYGLGQNEGFVVITGDVGTGKSTLVAQKLSQLDREAVTVAQIVTTAIDSEELIVVVANSFGLTVDGGDQAGALAAIEQFLKDEGAAGRRVLLVVDECQSLDVKALEQLRMLANWQDGAAPLLQTILLGQPQFRRMLAQHPDLEQLRQRIIASHNLDALSESEVARYVAHRLGQVGWQGNPAIGADLAEELFAASEGNPRRVHQVMNRLLLLSAIEEKGELTTPMLRAVLTEMAADASPPMPSAEVPNEVSAPVDKAAPEEALFLTEREERTAELEAAISGLQAMVATAAPSAANNAAPLSPDVDEAIERLEQRLEEQERSLRHVLTMLIEWLEDGSSREAA